MKIQFSFILLILLFLGNACIRNPDAGPEASGFDKGSMLNFYANQQIKPAYSQVLSELSILKERADLFVANPDSIGLIALRLQWMKAAEVWQSACAFNFGPAGEEGLLKSLQEEIATFPVSATKTEQILAGSAFNLNDFNRDTRGFFAIEYLIFGKNQSQKFVLDRFENPHARQYLTELCYHARQRVESVLQGWEGGFGKTFAEDKGTGTGSSTAMLYNEFVKSFEFLKNMKLGLPLGKRPGQTSARPDLSEAVFSGHSLKMMQLHFHTLCKIWNGTGFTGNGNGPGFRAYLLQSEGGPALVGSTEAQIQKVNEAFAALPAGRSFSDLLATNDPSVELLHTELQKLTRFFKSDMSSVLGITITYASGDGD